MPDQPVALQFKNPGGTTLNGSDGSQALQHVGPTTVAHVFLDTNYVPGESESPDMSGGKRVEALIDTGAALSCIDERLANSLNLPKMGPANVAGVGGSQELELRLVQIYLPEFERLKYASLVAVKLAEGGQRHEVLLGREFLMDYRMLYDGRSGVVVFENQSNPIPVIHSGATLKALISNGFGYGRRKRR